MKEYTRVASKVNNEGRTIITKSLIDHFATNRKRHIFKSEVIQTSMVDQQSVDFKTLFSGLSNDPNLMTETFHEIFESMLNVHVPDRKRKVRTEYALWITL